MKAFAPATVANLGCGFDVLGLALQKPLDCVSVRYEKKKAAAYIESIKGAKLSYTKNTALFAAKALLKDLGEKGGFALCLEKGLPLESGLGSSAASAVAALLALNAFLGKPYSRKKLLAFAVAAEKFACGSAHADNVAPALLGGLVLCRDAEQVLKVTVPKALSVAIVHPTLTLATKKARQILRKEISLQSSVRHSANLAAFVLGMERGDCALIKDCAKDDLIEVQRAPLIPYFYDLQALAYARGALSCSISGAGPSIFALCPSLRLASQIAKELQELWKQKGIEAQSYCSKINQRGGYVLS